MIVLGCLAALGIAWSDFGLREIHVGWFGLMGLAGIIYQSQQAEGFYLLRAIFFNLVCVGMMVGSIWVIYRLKGEKQIMDHLLGWGDVVMLLVLGIWLPPHMFLLLFTGTSLLLVSLFLVLQLRKKIRSDYPIPLAGALGVSFLPALLIMVYL